MSKTSTDSSDSYDITGYKIYGNVTPYHYNHDSIENAKPRYPKYRTLESRLDTYTCRSKTDVSTLKLAEAGFYYVLKGDQTRCFHCGLSLVN